MKPRRLSSAALLFLTGLGPALAARDLPWKFTVTAGDTARSGFPAECALPADLPIAPGQWPQLVEIKDGAAPTPVPAQLAPGSPPRLAWLMTGAAGSTHTYELRGWSAPAEGAAMYFDTSNDAVTLRQDGHPVAAYHFGVDAPPEGVPEAYARSGFVYPLWAPSGDELACKRPEDHRHHMGLWHAWVHTTWRGKPVDFWNIGDNKGTVRFAALEWKASGPVWAGLRARQEHVAFPAPGQKIVVLDEMLDLRAWKTEGGYLLDYDYTQKNVSDSPLDLTVYRYGGGLAYRGPASWTRGNSDYLTSEGKHREDAHQSRARWVAMSGATPHGTGGVTILEHPGNHDAPSHIRAWGQADGATGKTGFIFFNYVPCQETAWKIAPGETVTFRYRVFLHDGPPQPGKIDALWQDYAHPVAPAPSP